MTTLTATSLASPLANSGPLLTIDLKAIAHNYGFLRQMVAPSVCAAVVKADAYGLGMEEVSKALYGAGCRDFFVAWPEEALTLRSVLKDARIFVLHGPVSGSASELASRHITAVVNHLGQLSDWANQSHRLDRKLPVALHVDSGLNRLGMPWSEVEKLSEKLDLLQGLDLQLIMSHLAIPALVTNPMNEKQRKDFSRALKVLPKAPASLAASSGSFLGRDYLFDMVRIGSSIYGMNPIPNKPNPMRAVARLEFPVLQVQEIAAGETVGYGCTFKAEKPTRIATLGGGFSDGYMRSLSNNGTIWLGDYRLPVVGRVSMDLITVDVTDIPAHLVQPGQMIAILHEHYTVNHLAGEARTRTTEILCGLGRKPKRHYIYL